MAEKNRRKKTIRFETATRLLGWPLVSIACGPDFDKQESRGHARGIIAIGDIATGLFALGGLAGGGVAVGGLSVGVLTVGGVSLGGFVLAGVALGYAAFGGVAVGYYAKGGAGTGVHVVMPRQRDAEAVRFFDGLLPGADARPEPDAGPSP